MRGLANIFSAGKIFRRDRTFAPRGRVKPELPRITTCLVWLYCRAEQFDQGIAECREALRLKGAKPSAGQTASVATIRTNLAKCVNDRWQ